MADDPYRTPAPPETPEHERARLLGEEIYLGMSGMGTPEQNAHVRSRMEAIRARLAVLEGAARVQAFWRALTDEQRHELAMSCCRGCGKLETAGGRRCQCWNDE